MDREICKISIGSRRREPVRVVFFSNNYLFFWPKSVSFYKNTGETGSAREEPVHNGEPVRAVLVHMMTLGKLIMI